MTSRKGLLRRNRPRKRTTIQDIPNEILRLVFLEGLEPPRQAHEIFTDSWAMLSRLRDNPLPRTLSRVSQRWRSVAIWTPELWSELGTIWIDSFRRRTLETIDALLVHLTMYLERATSVNFKFSYGYLKRRADDAYLEERRRQDLFDRRILTLLVEHSSKWAVVMLDVRCPNISALAGIRGKLPRLEALRISVDEIDAFEDRRVDHPPFDYFAEAPRLKYLGCGLNTIYGRSRRIDDIHGVFFPWEQIEWYEDHWTRSSGEFSQHSILAKSPNRIHVLNVSIFDGVSFLILDSPTDLTQAHLTFLRLDIQADSTVFLRRLVCPSLLTLSLHYRQNWGTEAFLCDIIFFLENSGCGLQLEVLEIRFGKEYSWSLSPGQQSFPHQGRMIRILNICSNLRTLVITHIPPHDLELLSNSTQRSPGEPLSAIGCSLQSLTIEYKEDSDSSLFPLDCAALDAMARSRDAMYQKGIIATPLRVVVRSPFQQYFSNHTYGDISGEGPLAYSCHHDMYTRLSGIGTLSHPPPGYERFVRLANLICTDRLWPHRSRFNPSTGEDAPVRILKASQREYYTRWEKVHRALREIEAIDVSGGTLAELQLILVSPSPSPGENKLKLSYADWKSHDPIFC